MNQANERDRSSFAQVLRDFRLAAGLSQEALAEHARMSAGGISALERGARRAPHRETVALLAAALKLSMTDRARLEVAALGPARPRRRGGAAMSEVAEELHNLPLSLTSFIGRDVEVGQVVALIRRHRIVTLTGTGGIGKTRMALQVAADLVDSEDGGVWFVELAPLGDASLVAAAIAMTLGVQESPNRPLLETLLAHLKKKALLLVLDNCEHVITGAAIVADTLLRGCPELRILATSREPLRVAGEQTYRLPSLAAPSFEAVRRLGAGDGAAYASIALFAERARAIDHRFALTDDNAPIIAEICRHLDGIPLAIELAAARVTSLSVKALLEKLHEHFRVLMGGDRTALPRHQTMRALIDWSYDLLSPREQRLFERLSVFAGGCTLAAATAVCGEPDAPGADAPMDARASSAHKRATQLDVLELLSSLVDKSLVVADLEGCEPRYQLLESTRQYAREKLTARGDRTTVAHRHAVTSLELAERLEHRYDTASDWERRTQAEAELENFRGALEWTLTARGDVLVGQRLVCALNQVWTHFALLEGQEWMRAALELVDEGTPVNVVAKLEYTESCIASWIGDYKAALAAGERAMARYRDLQDPLGMTRVQNVVGLSLVFLGRTAEAERLLDEALETARVLGSRRLVARLLRSIANARTANGDVAGARAYFAEALMIYDALGAERDAAGDRIDLAELEFFAGDAEAALSLTARALATSRAHNDMYHTATALNNMAAYLVSLARYDEARACAVEALDLAHQQQLGYLVAGAVEHLAAVATLRPRSNAGSSFHGNTGAARLLGFVDNRISMMEVQREHTEQQEYDLVRAMLRDAIGADELADFMAAGGAMTEDQAIEEALGI